MPRREDLKSVLVIGSGPIVIGQGCEFDYSGTQACRVLKAGGHPGLPGQLQPGHDHDRPGVRRRHLRRADHPRGARQGDRQGAPGRRCCPPSAARPRSTPPSPCTRNGTLKKYDVELIGADIDAIEACEDREKFKDIVIGLGAEVPRSLICHTIDECLAAVYGSPARRPDADRRTGLGFPVVVRPSFTLGGLGSGIAYNEADLRRIAGSGLDASPTTEVLLEESIIGWKEFELELMRDRHDNVVIVCSIENVDPMGVHTGDSRDRRARR